MAAVCATILTGQRPDLLKRTLTASASVLRCCDHVIVFHNGGDEPTAVVLNRCAINYERVTHAGPMIPNGQAASMCAKLAVTSGAELWLHLEDDWELVPNLVAKLPDWFSRACEVAREPTIGQVRLREEAHLGRLTTGPQGLVADGSGASNANWCDGRLVTWRVSPDATFMVGPHHWTFNPALMRTAILGDGELEATGKPIAGVFPAETERHAMARFYSLNLLVAQMRPGVYRHTGEERHVGSHGAPSPFRDSLWGIAGRAAKRWFKHRS
jgi:hypothetical protein